MFVSRPHIQQLGQEIQIQIQTQIQVVGLRRNTFFQRPTVSSLANGEDCLHEDPHRALGVRP